ncbi:MAG: hypothetical protein JXR75_12415 [Rhodobacteraceae bacterium]|nr:hypothetical protein [Paracoccaceae bacterium]
MPKATPEDRACLDYAFRVVVGMNAEDEVIALRDGLSIATRNGVEKVDASSSTTNALIHVLAQAMQLHLGGVNLGNVRHDLLTRGMGVKAANRVYDHLVDLSVEEWDRLRARVRWYADDNCRPITSATQASGVS